MGDNELGEAIRILHHGVRESLRLAFEALEDQPHKAAAMVAIAVGYSLSLEVMTQRPAVEHLRSGTRWLARRLTDDPADRREMEREVARLGEGLAVVAPHDAYDKHRQPQ